MEALFPPPGDPDGPPNPEHPDDVDLLEGIDLNDIPLEELMSVLQIDLKAPDVNVETHVFPDWFDRTPFQSEGFDVDEWVESMYQRGHTMDELNVQLEAYGKLVEGKLVDITAQNFYKFLALSDDLPDIETRTKEWDGPLDKLIAQLTVQRDSMQKELDDMENALKEKKRLADERATLELMIETHNVVAKVERLLQEVGAGPAGKDATNPDAAVDKAIGVAECVDSDSDDDSIPEGYVVSEDEEGLDALEPTFATNASSSSAAAMALGGVDGKSVANDRAQLLERVSSEMGRLRFLQAKGKKLPFVRSMAPRIDACEESLAEAVASVLEDALSAPAGSRDRSRVEHCLRAHVAMDRVSEAEDAIARVLVQPAVAKVTGSASAETTFPNLLKSCVDAALGSCELELELTGGIETSAEMDPSKFCILGNCVLRCVDEAVHTARPGEYGPGEPDRFIRNHAAAVAAVRSIETRTVSEANVRAFRASDAYATYQKRWNLAAYFNIRMGEIAGEMTSYLDDHSLVRAVDGQGGFALAATGAAWKALERSWSDGVVCVHAADRFVRLAAQIVSRYGSWVKMGADAVGTEPPPAVERPPLPNDPDRKPRLVVPEHSWGCHATAEDLGTIRGDCEMLSEKIVRVFIPGMCDKLRAVFGDPAANTAKECMEEGVKELGAGAAADVNGALMRTIGDRCVETLKQMKGITATFRMTNKPLPTRHSHFVPGAVAPLRQFLELSAKRKNLTPESARKVAAAVGEYVSGKYTEMASELVAGVKKTEASLNRLKDRRAAKEGGSAAGGDDGEKGPSDTDKICKQLTLDVVEFGTQLAKLGTDPGRSERFKELWALVAPEGEKQVPVFLTA